MLRDAGSDEARALAVPFRAVSCFERRCFEGRCFGIRDFGSRAREGGSRLRPARRTGAV